MIFRIEQYRIFNVVAKTNSFSKAAEQLFMTQSAVSQAIKQLETLMDTILFKRTSKGVELTQAGNILYKYTSSAMELLETGLVRVEALKSLDEGELKIGASDTISIHFLLPHLETFHKLYPNIKVQIINRVSTETLELLKRGKIDIAFVNLPLKNDSVEIKECMTVHDTFVAGNGYEQLKSKTLTRDDISKLPLILLESKSNSRKYVDNVFLESGQILNASIELGAHELLLQLAKINLGISCVIKEFSKEYLDNNFVFELKQKNPIPPRAIGYCYSKNLHLTPSMQKFMSFLNSNSTSP